MANGFRGSFEVEGKNLQFPTQRHRRWRVAYRFVTGLIFELPFDGDGPFVGKHSANSIRSFRRYQREILGDAKLSFKDGNLFLDGLEVKCFGSGVNDGLKFDSWNLLQSELNRLVTLHSGRIDVYVRRKFDFGNQTDPAARYDAAIRLCKSELKMRRLDILHYLGAQLRKKFCNNIIRRQSIRVLRREILFANHAAGVDVEESGVGHSFGHSLGFAVEHVEAANDFGMGVSQQRKFDFVTVGEVLQDRRTIVADSRKLQSLRLKFLFCILQLHELRFAEGSPVRGAEEQQHRALGPLECFV